MRRMSGIGRNLPCRGGHEWAEKQMHRRSRNAHLLFLRERPGAELRQASVDHPRPDESGTSYALIWVRALTRFLDIIRNLADGRDHKLSKARVELSRLCARIRNAVDQ